MLSPPALQGVSAWLEHELGAFGWTGRGVNHGAVAGGAPGPAPCCAAAELRSQSTDLAAQLGAAGAEGAHAD